MEPTIYKFRNAVLGGFNRRDVMEYIERASGEARSKAAGLEKDLKEARGEKETLAEELARLKQSSGSAAQEEARVRASLEESTAALTRVRMELGDTNDKLAKAQLSLRNLQQQVDMLQPLAKQYEQLKDRVATVELDAHRKAQQTIDQANEEASEVRKKTVGWLEQVKGSYGGLKEAVASGAERLEKAGSELAAVRESLNARDEELAALTLPGQEQTGEETPHV